LTATEHRNNRFPSLDGSMVHLSRIDTEAHSPNGWGGRRRPFDPRRREARSRRTAGMSMEFPVVGTNRFGSQHSVADSADEDDTNTHSIIINSSTPASQERQSDAESNIREDSQVPPTTTPTGVDDRGSDTLRSVTSDPPTSSGAARTSRAPKPKKVPTFKPQRIRAKSPGKKHWLLDKGAVPSKW